MNEYRHYRGRGRGNYQHGNNYRNQLSNNIYGGGGGGGNEVRRCNTNHYTPLLPYPPFRETRPRWQRPPQHQNQHQHQHNWPPPLSLGPTSPHNRHYPFVRQYSPTNIQKQTRPASPLPGSEEARQKAIAEASARIKQQLNLAEGDIPFTECSNIDDTPDDCIILNELPLQVNKNQDRGKRRHNNSTRRSGNSVSTPTIEELRKKILAQFTYMSKGKIQNLVNNPGSTRYDNALQHLVRDMRLHLSSELRNMYTNRDAEPSDEHNKMIDHFNSIVPDLGIELVSLPDTMVAELSKILQLDVNNEISEMEEDVVNNSNENVLVEPEDMFKQAEKLLSSTEFLNVSYDLPNAEIDQDTNVNIDVNNSDSNSVNIYNYPPPNMSTTTTTTTTPTPTSVNNSENPNKFHENVRFDEDSIVYDNFFYSQAFTTTNEQNFTNLFAIPPVVPNMSLQQQQQQQHEPKSEENKLNIPLPNESEIIKECAEPEKQLTMKTVEVLRDTPIREDSSPFTKKIQQDPIYENAFKTNICDVNPSTITTTTTNNTNINTNTNTNTNKISIKFDPAWVSKLTNKDVSSNQIVKTPTINNKIVPKNKSITTTTSTITTTTLTTTTTTTTPSNKIDKLNVTSFLQDVITNNLLDLPKDVDKEKVKSKSSEREVITNKHKPERNHDFLDKRNKLISETSCESSKSLTERNEETEIARPFNRTRSHSPYDHYAQEKTTKNRMSLDERIKEMMKIQETRVLPKTKEPPPETIVKEPIITIKTKERPIETNKNDAASRKQKKRKKKLLRMQRRQKNLLEKQKQKHIERERLKEIERLRMVEKEKQKKIEMHQLKELFKRQQQELEKSNKLNKIQSDRVVQVQELEDTTLTSNLLNLKSVTCNLNKANNSNSSATSKIPIKLLSKTKSKTVVKNEQETSTNKDIDLSVNSIVIKEEPNSEEDSSTSSSSTSDNEIETSTDNLSDKSNNIIHNLTKDILNPPKSTSIRHFESIDNHLNISTITNTNATIQQVQNFKIILETNPNPNSILNTTITPITTTDTISTSTTTTSITTPNITTTTTIELNENKELGVEDSSSKNTETEIENNLKQVSSIESNSNIESVASNVQIIENNKENIIVTEKQSEQIETVETIENLNKDNNIMCDENSKTTTTTTTTICTPIITNENTDSNNTVITTNPVIDEKIIEKSVEPINTNKDETKTSEENTKTNDKKHTENHNNTNTNNSKKNETSNSNHKKCTSTSNTSSSNRKHRHGSVDRKKDTSKSHKRSDSKHKTSADSKQSSSSHHHTNSHSHNHSHSHHSSSNTLNLSSSKQKILNRLLDIDLQIHKLMQEKWNLYKELNLDQQLPVTEINSKIKTITTSTNTSTNDLLNISTQTDFPLIMENVIEKHISDVELLPSTPKKSKNKEKDVKTSTNTNPNTSNKDKDKDSKSNDSKIKRKESDINNKRNSRKRKLSESESSVNSNILESINTNNSEQIMTVQTNEIETKKHTKTNNKTRTTRNSLSNININNNNINNSKTEDETTIIEETINIVPKLKINLLNIKNKAANKHALHNKDKDKEKEKEDDEQIIKTSNSKKSKSKKLLETDSNTNTITENELISKEEEKIVVVNTRQRTTKNKKSISLKEIEPIQMEEEIPLQVPLEVPEITKPHDIIEETEIENKTEDTSITKRKYKKELKPKVLEEMIEKPITRRRNSRTRNRSSTPSLNDSEINSNPDTIIPNKRTRKRKNNTETITDTAAGVVVENKKNKLSIKGEVEVPTPPNNKPDIVDNKDNEEDENLLGFDTKDTIIIKEDTIVLEKQEEIPNTTTVAEEMKTNVIEEKEVVVVVQEVIQEEINVDKDNIILTPTDSESNIKSVLIDVDVDKKEEEEEEVDDINVTSYDKLVKSCFVQLERINITLNEEEQEQQFKEEINDDTITIEDSIKTIITTTSKEIDIIDENGIFCMGHQKSILDIKIIDNEFFAASEDGTIYKYCLKSGLLQDAYTGHKRAVTCIYTVMGSFLNIDSMLLYSGSLDCTLKCYNIDTAEVVHSITVAQAIQCLDSAWGYIFLGTYEGLLFIYNMKKKLLNENSLTIANATVLMIKATQEGSRQVLILASRKREIMVRDAFTGLLLRTMCEQQKPTIYSLLLHQSMVYCGTSDKGILILDFHNGQQINVYNCGKGVVCMLMYRSLLFAGCYDGLIYIYNTKTQKHVCTIKGPGEGMLLSLAITNDVIIAGSKKDHLLKIWKIPQEIFNQIQ